MGEEEHGSQQAQPGGGREWQLQGNVAHEGVPWEVQG